MYFPPSCSSLLAQNFGVFHDEKPVLFRQTSGGRRPIGVGAPALTLVHTSRRKRKEVIWSEKLHGIQKVIATTDHPLGEH